MAMDPLRPDPKPRASRRRRHFIAVLGSLALVAAAGTLAAYSATLYRIFCEATGYQGTTQRVGADLSATRPETMVVRFDTSIAPDLPWRFEPEQPQVTVHLGEQTLVYFRATNLSKEAIVGHASFNVQPDAVGRYFDKIQCFCFEEERLGPGQTAEMPVLFYVDPAILKDPDVGKISTITLSYTFFRSVRPEGASDLGRFEQAGAPSDHASAQRGPRALRRALWRLPRPRAQQIRPDAGQCRRPQGRQGPGLCLFHPPGRGGCHLVAGQSRQMAPGPQRLHRRGAHARQRPRQQGPARRDRLSGKPAARPTTTEAAVP